MNTITPAQALEIRTRNTALNAWIATIRNRHGWASYKPEDKPSHIPDVSNEERSLLEVWDFVNDPPDKYFLYINEEKRTATTFTGDTLGSVDFGRAFRDNFGGERQPVTIHGINGRTYHGTYFKSAGSYARIKRSKRAA